MYSRRCPLCNSEVCIGKNYYYCTNPNCSYTSKYFEKEAFDFTVKRVLMPFFLFSFILVIILLALGFLLLQPMFFFFLPLIFPFAFLKKFSKRRREED